MAITLMAFFASLAAVATTVERAGAALAEAAYGELCGDGSDGEGGRGSVLLRPLREHPRAIASRVLRLAALDAGAIDAELFHVHVQALLALVDGEISGEIQLPGHLTAYCDGACLRFRPTS